MYRMMFILESVTSIPVIILSSLFIALHLYLNRKFKFWQKLGIPYLKPTPIFGNFKDLVFQKVNIGQQLQQIYRKSIGQPYTGIFFFYKPGLLIRDLGLLKNVLVKDSHNFIDRVANIDEELDPMFGKSVFSIKGQRWRHLRTNLTTVFTSGKMKKMFYLVNSCGKELAECLDRATVGGCTVDVKDIMYRYTTDVIGSCAFGINGYSLKDPQAEFWRYLRNIYEFSIRKGLANISFFFAPKLASIFKLKLTDDATANYLRTTTWSTVEYRERNGIVRNDFLDCLIELRNRGKKDIKESIQSDKNTKKDAIFQIDGDDFVAQAYAFLAAGFETSGFTLSLSLYELSLQPSIQNRLRAEILAVLDKHNGEVTYYGIKEMSYLDMVVSETLRKYPVLPFLDRMCISDYKLPAPSGNGTVTLPGGTGVYIPVLALHHDPAYYPEPERFDPDRFTEENKNSRPNYTYMPFGEGPRICIGMRFALMQVKTALCHVLSRFEVAPCKDTLEHIKFDPKAYLLKVNGKLTLSFKRTNF